MVRYYNQNNNINIYNDDKIGLNTYKEEQEQKKFLYCYKCLRDFNEPSVEPFCSWECKKDYFAEERKEMDSCYREWLGRD